MQPPRSRRLLISVCLVISTALCLATTGYLAWRVTFPPRTLRVALAFDPSNPPLYGITPDQLKARVEGVSPLFQEAAGIRIVVSHVLNFRMPGGGFDPETMRRFMSVRTPREDADIIVAFWPAPPGDTSLGSTVPYSPVAIVRIVPGDPQLNLPIVAHQLLKLFGVPDSKDQDSVMNPQPTAMNLNPELAAYLSETRRFDFVQGLGGISGNMQNHVLHSLERERKSAGNVGSARQALAELYQRDGNFRRAAEQFSAVLHADPGNVAAHLSLSLVLLQLGENDAAEQEARTAMKLAPENADAHYRLASSLVRGGNPDAAIPEFRRALSLDPHSVRNRIGLAVAYASALGRFEDAEREFDSAIQSDPNNPVLLSDLAYVKNLRTTLTAQLQRAEDEVRLHPESGVARDSLALVLLRLGKSARAVTEAREAVRLSPDTWRPQYTLALALFATHDLAGSAAALAAAEKMGSGSRPYLKEALRSESSGL